MLQGMSGLDLGQGTGYSEKLVVFLISSRIQHSALSNPSGLYNFDSYVKQIKNNINFFIYNLNQQS
jgi:hypothetical protein